MIRPDRLAFDVPTALQDFDRLGHTECRVLQRLPQPGDLENRGQVAQENPTGAQRGFGVFHYLPGLGQVEQNPIEIGVIDAFVDVTDLHMERHVFAHICKDILLRPLSEVVAEFVSK